MPLPLVPVAAIALRYGTIALATYALTRTVQPGRRDQRGEDALDELAEGLTMRRDPEQVNTTARIRRAIRLNRSGKGVEIDAAVLTRFRLKRI